MAPDMHLKLVKMVTFMLHRSYHDRQASQTAAHRKSLHLGACARVQEVVQGSVARRWEESWRDAGIVTRSVPASSQCSAQAHRQLLASGSS